MIVGPTSVTSQSNTNAVNLAYPQAADVICDVVHAIDLPNTLGGQPLSICGVNFGGVFPAEWTGHRSVRLAGVSLTPVEYLDTAFVAIAPAYAGANYHLSVGILTKSVINTLNPVFYNFFLMENRH